MRNPGFRFRWALALIPAVALVISSVPPPAVAGKTDQEKLLRAVGKLLSSTDKPGKGLCACMSDTAMGPELKRVGVISRSIFGANPSYVTVSCRMPAYDANGDRLPGMPSSCDTWVPLVK